MVIIAAAVADKEDYCNDYNPRAPVVSSAVVVLIVHERETSLKVISISLYSKHQKTVTLFFILCAPSTCCRETLAKSGQGAQPGPPQRLSMRREVPAQADS